MKAAHMFEIDPNIRIAHGHTFDYIPDPGPFKPGDAVVVTCTTMQIAWPATIIALDHEPLTGDWYIEYDVAWDKHKNLDTNDTDTADQT